MSRSWMYLLVMFPQEIELGNFNLNLAGYAMGNAWISPIDSVLTWGGTLFWMVGTAGGCWLEHSAPSHCALTTPAYLPRPRGLTDSSPKPSHPRPGL